MTITKDDDDTKFLRETGLVLFKQKKTLNILLTSSAITLVMLLNGCNDELRVTKHSTAISHKDVVMKQVVLKPNVPPVAHAGNDRVVRVGEVVTLDGAKSSDSDHDLLDFTWKQTAGPKVEMVNSNTLAPSFIAPASKETLVFSLTVNDGQDNSAIASISIDLANRAPTANAGRTIIAKRGSNVILDGSLSIDPDDDNLNFQWTQVYGNKVDLGDSANISPAFTMPNTSGYLIFALTVGDGTDQSIADTVAVKISNTPPVAKINAPTNDVASGKKVQLDGTASFDVDGDTLAYSWSQILGTPVMLQDANTATPSFDAPKWPDHLVFELTVNDGEFSSHAVSQVVSIKNAVMSFEPLVPDSTKIGTAEVDPGLTPVKKKMVTLEVK